MSNPVLPACPHCHSCTAGPRIVIVHENQSACPSEGFRRFAIACRLCGVQGPVGNSEELARTLWAEWCERLTTLPHKLDSVINQRDKAEMERDQLENEYRQIEAANEGNIARLMVAKQAVKEVEHLLDSVRTQRDKAEKECDAQHAITAKVHALLDESRHERDAIRISRDHLSQLLGNPTDRREKFPDIIDTWILDGEPAPWSATVRVSDIASVGAMQQTICKRLNAKSPTYDIVRLPSFEITLHGGKKFGVGREDSATRACSRLLDSSFPDGSGLTSTRAVPFQSADNPSTLMTETFRRELIVGWVATIAAK
jgi:hypothetical protein